MTQPKSMGGLGFKDIELFNLALLARQAWRVLQEPESLSARVLKSVYFPNTSILEATLGAHPSQIWRSIIEGRDTLKQGLIKRISNGETTRIWTENWLPRDEMLRPYGCLTPTPPMFVSELIDPTTATWNMQRLREVFLPFDAKIVVSIPLCTRNTSDFCCWHFEKNGQFTVRSAYNMLVATRK